MDLSTLLQICAVIIECIIVVLAIRLASAGSKPYGWWIALTFALYAFFDLSRLGLMSLPAGFDAPMFLVASLSMLTGTWLMLQEPDSKPGQRTGSDWL